MPRHALGDPRLLGARRLGNIAAGDGGSHQRLEGRTWRQRRRDARIEIDEALIVQEQPVFRVEQQEALGKAVDGFMQRLAEFRSFGRCHGRPLGGSGHFAADPGLPDVENPVSQGIETRLARNG